MDQHRPYQARQMPASRKVIPPHQCPSKDIIDASLSWENLDGIDLHGISERRASWVARAARRRDR